MSKNNKVRRLQLRNFPKFLDCNHQTHVPGAKITLQQPTIAQSFKVVIAELPTEQEKEALLQNPDVQLWLNKIGRSTWQRYTKELAHYLKCVGIQNPTELLDLKGLEDPKRRYFPAEQLAELWALQARREGKTNHKIKATLDAVRSFYKHNRIPLVQVRAPYKPRQRQTITPEELRKFRDALNIYGRILFDFLLSVPLRDGQFSHCQYCGQDFFPRWQHITTYPKIEDYSPFVIQPQKGHESMNYSEGLRQVCFLTQTAANQLNVYRAIKEKALGRPLAPSEYIFTHQKHFKGIAHVTPFGR